MTDFWIHDSAKCKICRGRGNIGKPGVLEHLLLALQQSGEIEGEMVNGELKYHLTKKGIDYVENKFDIKVVRETTRK